LRAKERLPELRPLNTVFDRQYQVPTFQEVISLAKREGVGIYPETKHPTYFDRLGLSLEEPLPWTFRRENSFLPTDFRQGNHASPLYFGAPGNLPGELELFYELGVDGVFSDNPDIAVAVRAQASG